MMQRGVFITVEGGEGLGKSTQVVALGERLQNAGYDVVLTREPGGTSIGKQIRILLLHSEEPLSLSAELLLMNADRAQHVAEIIKPALQAGKIVICDRYVDSTIAYQGYGDGWDLETLWTLHEIATNNLLPDITFVMEGTPHRPRGDDRFERLASDFHERVQQSFTDLTKGLTDLTKNPTNTAIRYSINANNDPKDITDMLCGILQTYPGIHGL